MKTTERRYVAGAQLRMAGDEAAPAIEGYAAVFDSLSEDLGGFREVIAPGAFAGSLREDVRALWNHDANHVLGRNKSGTLDLAEDQKGLRVRIEPPASAGWILESLRRGDVDQMSFGFRTIEDKWEIKGGEPLRTLIAVRLFDVSVVTFPAYPETEAGLRSLNAFRAASDDAEPNKPQAGAEPVVPSLAMRRARLRLLEI